MCEDTTVILSILRSYVLNWYHTYLLHPGMDRTEAIILQHFYSPDISDAVQKEVKIVILDNVQNGQIKIW